MEEPTPVPMNKVPDINIIHYLDFMTYQYALEGEQYKTLIGKGTVQSQLVMLHGFNAGFALWERGSVKKPAFIHRLGVLPRLIVDGKVVLVRRNGLGTGLLNSIVNDVKQNKKPGSNMTLQMVLSHYTCLGPSDPDDVSEFMKNSDFTWSKSYPDAFFEYGNKVEGLVFERNLA